MRSVVVHESCYGNTRSVAEAVADALRAHGDVDLVAVDDPLPDVGAADLLVVGGPTHVHGLSTSMSRKGAAQDHPEASPPGIGARGWLHEAPAGAGRAAAAFDTRIEKPVLLVGSAARGIARRLHHHGYDVIAPAESFFVLDAEGPLKQGELERAAEWAHGLAARAVA